MGKKGKFLKLTSGVVLLGSAPSLVSMAADENESALMKNLKLIVSLFGIGLVLPYIGLLIYRKVKFDEVDSKLKEAEEVVKGQRVLLGNLGKEYDELVKKDNSERDAFTDVAKKKKEIFQFVKDFIGPFSLKLKEVEGYGEVLVELGKYNSGMKSVKERMQKVKGEFVKFDIKVGDEDYKDENKWSKAFEVYKEKSGSFIKKVTAVFGTCNELIRKIKGAEKVTGSLVQGCDLGSLCGRVNNLGIYSGGELVSFDTEKLTNIVKNCEQSKLGPEFEVDKKEFLGALVKLKKEIENCVGGVFLEKNMKTVKNTDTVVKCENLLNFTERVCNQQKDILERYQKAAAVLEGVEKIKVDPEILEKLKSTTKEEHAFMSKQVDDLIKPLKEFIENFESKVESTKSKVEDFFVCKLFGVDYKARVKAVLDCLSHFNFEEYYYFRQILYCSYDYLKNEETHFLDEKLKGPLPTYVADKRGDIEKKKLELDKLKSQVNELDKANKNLREEKYKINDDFYSLNFFKSFD